MKTFFNIPKNLSIIDYIVIGSIICLMVMFYLYNLKISVYSELFYLGKPYFSSNSTNSTFDQILSLSLFFLISFAIIIAGFLTFGLNLFLKYLNTKQLYNLEQKSLYKIFINPIIKSLILLIITIIIFSPLSYFLYIHDSAVNAGKMQYITKNPLYCKIVENKANAKFKIATNTSVPYELFFTKDGILYKTPNKEGTLIHEFSSAELQDMINLCIRKKHRNNN